MKKTALIALVVAMLSVPVVFAQNTPTPYGQSGNWSLVFSDEFDGASLDLNKWRPNWLGSSDTSLTPPINTSEYNCYNPADVSVANGLLVLDVSANSASGCRRRNGSIATYSSGMVQSNGHFNTAYGYFEARIKVPAGVDHQSVWPAFWTNGQNWPTTGEIDIMECYGTDASCSYHYHYSGGGPGGNFTMSGSTTDFHIYAAYWEPGRITWYWDGAQVWQYTTGIVSAPHYIILNLGTRGTSVVLSSQMLVDYVRVWKAGANPTITATRTVSPVPSITPTTPTKTALPTSTSEPTSTSIPTGTASPPPSIVPTCDPTYIPHGVCIYVIP